MTGPSLRKKLGFDFLIGFKIAQNTSDIKPHV